MPLCEDIAPFFWDGVQKHLAWRLENLFNTNFQQYGMPSCMCFYLCFCESVCGCMNVFDILEGFQSYSGHPRISLFLLFSSSSHWMRGSKYCMSGWALIMGWPVIMVIASGQGLLKPSFITSLQTLAQVREGVQRRRGSVARVCSKDNYTHGVKHVFTSCRRWQILKPFIWAIECHGTK